jgi:hypothetical protein
MQPTGAPTPGANAALPQSVGASPNGEPMMTTPQLDVRRALGASASQATNGEAMPNGDGSVVPLPASAARQLNPTRNMAMQDAEAQMRIAQMAVDNPNLTPDQDGRWKSAFKRMALGAAQGAATGGVGGLIGGAAGGFAGGAINPRWNEQARAAEHLQKQKGVYGETVKRRQVNDEFEDNELDRELKRANIEKARRPPVVKPIFKKQAGVTYQVDADGTATAIVGANGEPLTPDTQRPVFVDTLDDDGVTMQRNQYNPTTGKYEPVMIGDAPAVVRRVQRVNPESGMTESGERADADRDAGRTETIRHNKVGEVFGQQNFGLSRQRFAESKRHSEVVESRGGGRSGANPAEARRTRAATQIGKLNDVIAKAQGAVTQRQRDALRRKANAMGQLIRSQYGDIVSDGDEGLPTRLNSQAASPSNGNNGGRYAGQRFNRANIGTIRQRLGVASDEEAQRIVEAQGGVFN